MPLPPPNSIPEPAARWRPYVVAAFFGLLLLLGLLLHRDYGVSWDEPTDHLNGLVNVKYMVGLLAPEKARTAPGSHLIPDLHGYRDNDHGVLFEIPVAVLGYFFTRDDSRSFYFLRHFLIFGTFVLGVWGVYRVGRLRFRDWRLGLLAAGLLVLSPRMFAEAFFNGKDILFLGVFALAMSTLARLTERPGARQIGWAGLATAAAIDVRILGAILVPFALGLLALEAIWAPPAERWRLARLALLYLGVAAAGTVAGWPYLWENPVGNFVAAFRNMSHYPWHFTNFYLGEFIKSWAVPWHYVPVWMSITTPVPYLLAGLMGLGVAGWQRLRGGLAGLKTPAARLDLLLLGWLLGPLLLVIGLHSALYDTWRHLYFIYPALLLLAVRGAVAIRNAAVASRRPVWRQLAVAAAVLATLETGRTVFRMVRLHPYEQLYFSFLPAKVVEQQFDRDYWGLTFRPALEWLLAHDSAEQLRIYVKWPCYNPLYNNTLIQPAAARPRIRYVSEKEADYFITAYRWHPQSFADSMGREVHTRHAEGIKILSVFRRR